MERNIPTAIAGYPAIRTILIVVNSSAGEIAIAPVKLVVPKNKFDKLLAIT
jgi:hypothetical protein